MTDIVFIQGLRIDGLIGVYAHERTARRPLVFDIEMRFDTRVAAASDQLAEALDYHAVSMRLVEFAGESSFQLVETLAERCAALLLSEFGATGVRLKLAKPGAFEGADTVGVVIERGNFA